MGRKRKKITLDKVDFTGIADRGKAVGRDPEGKVVFATGPVPGDTARVIVSKKRKGFFLGEVQEYYSFSGDRTLPFCQHYDFCGGCKWQHMQYAAQLRHKEQVVKDALQRIGKVQVGAFEPILGSEETVFYRNKLEFSFSNRRWLTPEELGQEALSNQADVLGFHPPGAFDKIIDIEKCWLQPEPSNHIRNTIRDLAKQQDLSFYDIREHKGFLRTMMLRTTSLGEVLLLIAFGEDKPEARSSFLEALMEALPEISSVYYCINTKLNDFMMDLEMVHVAGTEKVEEHLGQVRFKIGPKSFFQTNTRQAERLYDLALEFADLKGEENVYDLYTGLGSIALYLAKSCKQVVGIEEIPAAIEDARNNARFNGVNNTKFYAGDVREILTLEFAQIHGRPDLLITDPPRAGMHPDVVRMLLQLRSPKIVYISCNPSTQARDVQVLSEAYEVIRSRPVDMFPHTHHIENVALLKLKAQQTN